MAKTIAVAKSVESALAPVLGTMVSALVLAFVALI